MAARGPGFRQFSATMLEANLDLVIAILQCLEKFLRMPTLQTSVCVSVLLWQGLCKLPRTAQLSVRVMRH